MNRSLPIFVLAFGTLVFIACGSSSSDSGASVIENTDGGSDGSTTTDGGRNEDSGTSNDAGKTNDGGPGGFVAGAPITATAVTWTWVPFSTVLCGDGSASGLGVNLSSASTRVLIYLEGGGACWDDLTCFTEKTAANFSSGYNETDFDSDESALLTQGIFDRTNASNPFKDYSFVFIPYCSGDQFSGSSVRTFASGTATFNGFENVTQALDRIVPTFPTADRVILSGSGAGAYGAVFDWYQAQQAFGSVRVDVIADSGTFLPSATYAEGMSGNNQTAQAAAWNSASTIPPCSTCGENPADFYGFYATQYPTHKSALLSYQMDSIEPSTYGITESQFTTGLDGVLTSEISPNANVKAFVEGSTGSTLLFSLSTTQGTTTLQTFLTQMVTDDAAWATVTP